MQFPTQLAKQTSRVAVAMAQAAWPLVKLLNEKFERPSPHPSWAPGPLLKSRERTFPKLGWPRETDSLCPKCVKEVREDILSGRRKLTDLVDGRPGEVKAHIIERDGQILMEKTCDKHGVCSDVMSIDPQFMERIEHLFPGRDFPTVETSLRSHGTSTMKYGRGAVMTIDLTNRCNMMCDPCFMDANQVGFVHELSWDEIKRILDDTINVKPRRQMSIQFSGGEPTLSPYFLDAIRYAREVGYFAVQCATNGLRFAQEPGFAKKAKEAGLRMACLRFDGTSNESNAHRKISNLFDVKLRAIEELHGAGIDVILVVTLVNGVNNDQVGKIIEFAIENSDKITVVSFQPVSFTGRDEDIDDETRAKQRYTLSHLVHDMKNQTGVTEPMRDWFPLSAMGPFSNLTDLLIEQNSKFGAVNCGCHPNCGVGTILFVNKKTKKMVPLLEFLDVEQFAKDVTVITDGNMPKAVTMAQTALALIRNFRPERAPEGYDLLTLFKQFLSQTGARGKKVGQFESDAHEFEWRVLFVAGMWFQDLFNYDFRRTEMCIIPYGTQMGEISFCAYNTGVGWRNIVEQMMANATVAEWYKQHGRHDVFAKNRPLDIPVFDNPLTSRLPGVPDYVKNLNEDGKLRLRVLG